MKLNKYVVGLVCLAAAALFLAFLGPVKLEKTEKAPAVIVTPPPETKNVNILFAGDIFFDRAIRRAIERNDNQYLWEPIGPLLASYEFKVGNLEGPIWKAPPPTLDTMDFAFQPEHVAILKELGFTAVSLANNHTWNEGEVGLQNTRSELAMLGIEYFGDPRNVVGASSWKGEWHGKKIALVGEHNLVPQGRDIIEEDIRALKSDGYFVIVYPHWGAEYVRTIPKDEEKRAKELIDAGADLIIGAHPHVVQPIEIYQGKAIFYSLGNLLFDQYFSPETMQGLLVGLKISADTLEFTLHPTIQKQGTYQIHPADQDTHEAMLKHISENSNAPEEVKTDILSGRFELAL